MENVERYIAGKELSKRSGLTYVELLKLAKEGQIPCIRVGAKKRGIRFQVCAVMKALARR